MARKKPASDVMQTNMTFRIPRELHKKLADAANAEEGGSIGEEIRRRLESSFSAGTSEPDPKTGKLLNAISRLAADIEDAYAPWHEDRYAYDLFVQAFRELLAYSGSDKGEQRPPRSGSSIERLMRGRDASPEDISRAVGIAAAAREGFL